MQPSCTRLEKLEATEHHCKMFSKHFMCLCLGLAAELFSHALCKFDHGAEANERIRQSLGNGRQAPLRLSVLHASAHRNLSSGPDFFSMTGSA